MVQGHGGVALAVDLFDGGDDRTILLSHATGFCKELWDPVMAALRPGPAVVRFDTRAHGDSGDPGPPYDWWDLGHDVLAVVAATSGEHLLGVGHSAGGAALVLAELLAPGTFDALVLIEPIIFRGPARRVEGHPLTEGALRRRPQFSSLDSARANFSGKSAFSRWRSDAFDAYVRGGLRPVGDGGWELKCLPESEADFYRGALATGAWDRLHELTVPVTLVAGEHSETHTAGFLAAMAAEIQDVAVEVVAAATHFVPMEEPEAVAAIIERALE